MIALLLEAVLASTLLMLLVLAIRAPARRAFGARVAYGLWAMPVLRLLLPPMPEGWRGQALPTLPMPEPITLYLGQPVATLPVTAVDGGIAWPDAALVLWGVVAAAFLGWQIVGYFRFRHRVLRNGVAVDRVGTITVVETAAATGPLAFGVIDRVVAFPHDFPARFDGAERDLALAHELNHHARGDLLANWVALAMLTLHWFNPVAWFAYRAFRADQEMANDAGVLARCGAGAAHAYGCAIVKAAHGRALTPACHLHTIDGLKGRLKMLGRKRVSRARMAAGAAGAAVIAVGALGLTASGTQAAEKMRAKMETVTGVELAALDPMAAVRAIPATTSTAPEPTRTERRQTRVTISGDGKTQTLEGAEAEAYLAQHPSPVSVGRDGRSVIIPPVPPMPPVPPAPTLGAVPPVPDMPAMPAVPDVPVVADRDCGRATRGNRSFVIQRNDNGRRTTVICTDRIDASTRVAADRGDAATRARAYRMDTQARTAAVRANVEAARAERQAMLAERHAMVAQQHGLATALAGLQSARRTMLASVPAEHRADAVRSIDEAIAEMRENMKETGRD